MKAVTVICATCLRSWKLDQPDSLYLQLDLSSRPCPHCEAYTLSCRAPGDSGAALGRKRPSRRLPLRALARARRA
jgi:hypothetical protein